MLMADVVLARYQRRCSSSFLKIEQDAGKHGSSTKRKPRKSLPTKLPTLDDGKCSAVSNQSNVTIDNIFHLFFILA